MATAPEGHSKLSPSKSEQWSVCTASIDYLEANKHLLPKDTSAYADEGTKAHGMAAEVLTGKARLVNSTEPDTLLNVRAYIDFVNGQALPGDDRKIEHRVSLFYLPSQWGTIDVRLLNKERLAITDLKFGVGVGVYAEQNKQLGIYAESAVQEIELVQDVSDDFPIEMTIFQPRDRNDPEPVRSWTITRKELREFTAPIAAAADLILHHPDKVVFSPGPKVCRWCRAKGICKAYATDGLVAISEAPVDEVLNGPVQLSSPENLTREQRVRILDASETFNQWLKAVEAQEVHDLMHGAKPQGWKMVESNTHRKWGDETAAVILLSSKGSLDVVAPRSPLSPSQAGKMFKKDSNFMKEMNALVVKPPGKPTLVPESDKRQPMALSAAQEFEDIDLV